MIAQWNGRVQLVYNKRTEFHWPRKFFPYPWNFSADAHTYTSRTIVVRWLIRPYFIGACGFTCLKRLLIFIACALNVFFVENKLSTGYISALQSRSDTLSQRAALSWTLHHNFGVAMAKRAARSDLQRLRRHDSLMTPKFGSLPMLN